MRILGVDPGTGILGFGVIDVDGQGKAKLVDGGTIHTPKEDTDSARLSTIYNELKSVIKSHKPEVASIEKLFFAQNVTTAMTVAQARGVVLLLCEQFNLKIYEYTPLQIKQALTGYGRAEKRQMQEMVKVILKLDKIPRPDDCADALAAAITCSMNMR